MSTIIKNCGDTEHNYDRRIHLKGAAEIVLKSCSHFLNQEGKSTKITDELLSHLSEIINEYAKQALRTIVLAFKDLEKAEGGVHHTDTDDTTGENIVE